MRWERYFRELAERYGWRASAWPDDPDFPCGWDERDAKV